MKFLASPPYNTAMTDGEGNLTAPWLAWFSQASAVITPRSGTAAQRPTKGLYAGMMYFDTSLGANGKPIWLNKNGTGWVLADGTAA